MTDPNTLVINFFEADGTTPAQADVDPTIASMLLCLESVFAVLAGAVILGEGMGMREILGCLLMFAAIVVAQLPSKEDRLKDQPVS